MATSSAGASPALSRSASNLLGGNDSSPNSSAASSAALTAWNLTGLRRLADRLREEFSQTKVLRTDEAVIYDLQDKIKSLNELRHFKSLQLRNVDRKINFLVQSQLQRELKKEERDREAWFEFFDQSASQDNPLGLKKSDYAAFLYLLRLEPVVLAKALMRVPYADMDYVVQVLNFSLFPDLFQAREEILLLELCKQIVLCQVEISAEPQDMFRQNSFVTKLLGGYTRRHHGRTHLVTCLKDIISEFVVEASQEGMFELRPEILYKMAAGNEYDASKTEQEMVGYSGVLERQTRAKERVEYYAWRMLRSMKDNLPSMPFGMRYICKQMLEMAATKFELNEKQRYTLVSSFIILRYFNPAILVPETFGLADRDIGGPVRRSLTLLTKVLQNYANEIAFGGKESFMAVFNDSRDMGIQFLKEYCFMVADVPELNDYYATVTNLPQRKDEFSDLGFHNTTITLSPNQLYRIHRLIAAHSADLIPRNHPLGFFLSRLGPVPDDVLRADDKFFTIQLAGADDMDDDDIVEDGSNSTSSIRAQRAKKDLVQTKRATAEAIASALVVVDLTGKTTPLPPDELGFVSGHVLQWLTTVQQDASDDEVKRACDAAIKAIKQLPQGNQTDAQLLLETERFLSYRKSYRSSLAKEKVEMQKSIETLQSEADKKNAEEALWSRYLENIVQSAFRAKIMSKKEYRETMRVGPHEYSFGTLEKAGCFVLTSNLESSVKKNTVFHLASSDSGVVEMLIKTDGKKDSRPLRLAVLTLLDLLATQDHIKVEGFLFDIRGLCAFLNAEICG